jgi:hypothetical protein
MLLWKRFTRYLKRRTLSASPRKRAGTFGPTPVELEDRLVPVTHVTSLADHNILTVGKGVRTLYYT